MADDPYAGIASADPYAGIAAAALPPVSGSPVAADYNAGVAGAPTIARTAGLTGQALADDVQGMGDQVMNMNPAGAMDHAFQFLGNSVTPIAALVQNAFGPAADVTANAPRLPTREDVEAPAATGVSGPSSLIRRIPQIAAPPANATERGIYTAASMAPSALTPGGAIPRLALAVLPGIGSFGASEATRALGGNDTEQQMAGGAGAIAGGYASTGERQQGTPPQIGDISADSLPKPAHVIRALQYVASKTGTPDPTIMDAAAAGKPTTLFQRAGDPGRKAMLTLTAKPGQTAGLLNDYAGDPNDPSPENQGILGGFRQRAQDDFSRITGVSPEAVSGDMEALEEQKRSGDDGTRALYAQSVGTQDQPRPVLMTQPLASVMQEPPVADAVKLATKIVGKNATVGGLAIDPDTGAQVIDPNTKQPVTEQQPTAYTMDLAKKILAKSIARNPDGTIIDSGKQGVGNLEIQHHLSNLNDALQGNDAAGIPSAIPGYSAAVASGGDILQMQQAFKRGQQTIFDETPQGKYGTEFGGLSPANQDAWRAGMANAVRQRAVSPNFPLTPKAFSSPLVQGKLATAFGHEQAGQITDAMSQEKAIKDSLTGGNASRRQSITGTVAEGSKDMDISGMGPLGTAAVHGATMAGLGAVLGPGAAAGYGVNLLRGAIPRMVSNSFAMPEPARDLAGRILTSPTLSGDDIPGLLKQAKAAKPRLVFRGPGILDRLWQAPGLLP
jgi:hypothetical protein